MSLVPFRSREAARPDVVDRDRPQSEIVVRESNVLGGTYFGSGGGGLGTGGAVDNSKLLTENYYANIYVYACVKAIATDLAARPFRVGADPENPTDYDRDHPLAVRLGPAPGGPNPTTAARRLWAWSAAQRLIFGALAWEVTPSDLWFWPLPQTDLKPIKQDNPRKVAQTGWFKEFEVGYGRETKKLPADRVFYSWNAAQDDWTRAETALQSAKLDVQVAVMQDVYDNAFLRNDARPASIVVHQSFTDEAATKKFRRQFLNRHQGPGNAGRVAFVEANPQNGGAAPKDSIFVQQLGLTQRDAQFVERYEAKLRSITVAFGVPLSRLGDASKRTFSNADRETLNYWLDTVQPLAQDVADDVNLRLMPLFDSSGNVGWFDFSGVPEIEAPRRFSIPEVLSMKAAGVMTLEETRKEIGVPIVPTLGELPDPTEAPDDDALPVIEPAPSVAASAEEIASLVQQVVQGELAALRSTEPPPRDPGDDLEAEVQAANEYRARVWHQTDRTVRSIETVWEKRMAKLLAAQQKAVLSRLEGKRGRQALARVTGAEPGTPANVVADNVFDYAFWLDETEDVFEDLYADVVRAAFVAFDTAFDVAFDVEQPFAQNYILERTNYLARNVTDTTYEGIKDALAKGVSEGESIPDLAARINNLFNVTWPGRPETVARTEVISAYNGSTWLSVHNSPEDVIGGLQWISTRDDRTRPTHAAMDGTTITRNQAFELDGATLMYPGDPEVATRFNSQGSVPSPGSVIINCRCTIAPVVVDKMPPQERGVRRSVAERALIAAAAGVPLRDVVRSLGYVNLPGRGGYVSGTRDTEVVTETTTDPTPSTAVDTELVREIVRDADGQIIKIIERKGPSHADD